MQVKSTISIGQVVMDLMWAEEYLEFCVITSQAATSFRNWNMWVDSCMDPFYPRCGQYEKLSMSFDKNFCTGEKL